MNYLQHKAKKNKEDLEYIDKMIKELRESLEKVKKGGYLNES